MARKSRKRNDRGNDTSPSKKEDENKTMKLLNSIVIILTFVCLIFSGYFFIEKKYAKAKDFDTLKDKNSLIELKLENNESLETLSILTKQLKLAENNGSGDVEILEKKIAEIKQNIDRLSSRRIAINQRLDKD